MTKFLNYIFVLSLIISTNNSLAWDNGGVTTTILSVTGLQNGSFYVTAEHDICDAGETNKTAYVYKGREPNGLNQTPEGINMLLSIALTASVTGSKVRLYADDSGRDWGCNLGAIKVHR